MENNSAPRAARTLVEFFHLVCQTTTSKFQIYGFNNKAVNFSMGTFRANQVKGQRYLPFIWVLGTKAYMPPEFVRFGWYDGSQSTIWALGMILVNLLSSSMAFRKPEEAFSRSPRLKANLSQGITMVTSPAAFLTSL